ncbi:GAF and ANTAR domain-containing protein [Nocardia sp. NPDC051321]|uniref:GAF and ANTAR domain-containing protein n=1 Tax=Nocardia sp. NPDC051321 TaxID=3364323 RepID=UPI0037AEA996
MTFANVPDTQRHLVDAMAAITTSMTAQADPGTVMYQITEACHDLLDAAASGIILSDPRGAFAVAAASDERARLVELLQSQLEQGPCVDAIRDNRSIEVSDLRQHGARWPDFVTAASEQGYRSLLAVPMRLNGQAVGGLNVLCDEVVSFGEYQRQVANLLAASAVLVLTLDRDENRADRLVERTLGVLNDRAATGHAVGLLAGALDIDPADARGLVERYARARGLPLREVTRGIIDGTIQPVRLTTEAG